ncbi:MAG: glycosyltransferase family 4 protein [Lyngbya sp. HA4199-MV5]|jgi:glycosyltransferase involved in cell wall biosynthesis|nr:glycosyltransferase family 4 protein [Lyngbya sp. HA4199-MV5]
MSSSSTVNDRAQTSEPVSDTARIKVLTPKISLSDNQYLTCLWSAVKPYGVEIESFDRVQFWVDRPVADVIHLHWIQRFCPIAAEKSFNAFFRTLKALFGFAVLKLQGYQLVWTVHNTLSHDSQAPRFEYSFRWVLAHLCSDIIVMSEYSKQEFTRLYGRTKRIHIVPHGNYIGTYPNQIGREVARQQLGLAPQQKVLLHLGQIKPYKGIDRLLAAFQQSNHPDVVLLIAGACRDQALTAAMQQAAQADPRLLLRLEFIDDDDIQVYMNACDWVVLPYQKILNSGSALLALSFSRPVIVPQKGALTELIQDGEQGICYANDADLTEAIDQALAMPSEQWQQMCLNAYKLADKFDWQAIGATLYQLYQQRLS